MATYSNATHVATLYFDGVVEGTVTTGAEYLRSSTDGLQIAYNANPPSFVPRAFSTARSTRSRTTTTC